LFCSVPILTAAITWCGVIEPGRRADPILFDGDPLGQPRYLLGTKTVMKDGVIRR
jgi:imidazolonepropionase-like amidohydrolase